MGEAFKTASPYIEPRPTGTLEKDWARNSCHLPRLIRSAALRDEVAAESFPYVSVNRGADDPCAATNSS
jgi:hypothetical protein